MSEGMVLETVRVELGERSYNIEIGTGLLAGVGAQMRKAGLTGRSAVITNETVSPLYSSAVLGSLRDAGYSPELIVIPDGEEYKSLQWASHLYDRLLEMRYDRKCSLVALGGGVIGDLTGFVAATYMRGIPFVQVPTTLLSQVDSSVGGKTGVNHPLGKNMIGAFYQPVHVCADVTTLGTLPSEEFVSGMAEVVKYGVIYDAEFFRFVEDNRDTILRKEPAVLAHVIRRSCEIKADVVAADERESGLRAILNYGHTIGHAIEMLTNYTGYRHGEAVSIGMVVAARLAHKSGLCGREVEARVEALLGSLGLPVKLPELGPESIMSVLSLDKKAEAGRVKFVLPKRIGEVVITADWKDEVLLSALKA
jgi:3-dehydroquinate synthase